MAAVYGTDHALHAGALADVEYQRGAAMACRQCIGSGVQRTRWQ